MSRIHIEEAYLRAKKDGIGISKIELGRKIWPNSKRPDANIANLFNGKTKALNMEQVHTICDELGTTPNQLFNYNL